MLDQDQKDQFRERGYLVAENVVDAAALGAARREYASLMDRLYVDWSRAGLVSAPTDDMTFWEKLDQCCAGDFEWYQSFDISLPHNDICVDTPMHLGPAVFDLMTHPKILDIAEALIGPEITSNPIQHVRIKPPQYALPNTEERAHVIATDWHQDKGVTLEEADDTEFVTIWLAVTDATVENGCLQVAAGKQETLLPHYADAQVRLADEYIPTDQIVPAPVKAGGAVIFHPLTPHSSLANRSDEYRWSFDLRYSVTGQPTGRRQFPAFIARSRSDPGQELHDWRVWKEMWEEARLTLATTFHVPQHRWPASPSHQA